VRLQVPGEVVSGESRVNFGTALIHLLAVPVEHSHQQRVLAREVIQQTALAQAGGLRNGIERQVAGALRGNELVGGLENAVARSRGSTAGG
jgi:hypothetical protein